MLVQHDRERIARTARLGEDSIEAANGLLISLDPKTLSLASLPLAWVVYISIHGLVLHTLRYPSSVKLFFLSFFSTYMTATPCFLFVDNYYFVRSVRVL